MPEIKINEKVFDVQELNTKQVLQLLPTLKKFKIEPGKEWADIAADQLPITFELLSKLYNEPEEYFDTVPFGLFLELISSLVEANLGILKNLNSTLGRIVKLTKTVSSLSLEAVKEENQIS